MVEGAKHMRTQEGNAEAPKMPKPSSGLRAVQIAFVALCAIVIILPFVGVLWAPTMKTTENRTLAEMPALEEDGKPNLNIMGDLGSYFEDHFAYRNELVTANAKLRALLGTSSTDSAILGDDGWLFYGGTTPDYLGTGRLTSQEAENLAFDFSLVQGYCESVGANFALAIVPNKNSIYPEKMPFYFGKAAEGSVFDELNDKLDSEGVHHADLYSLLSESKAASPDEELYYRLDTHWNQQGALEACEELMDVLGREDAAKSLSNIGNDGDTESHTGDLSEMLYPADAQSEQAPSYADGLSYQISEGANEIDTEASAWIEATGEGSGTLYMFRDSFAQNMIPFLASEYATSFFDWYVPFDYTKIEGREVTDVVVEKAERSLGDLAENPGIMPAPSFTLSANEVSAIAKAEDADGCVPSTHKDGSLVVIEGELPHNMRFSDLDDFFIMISGESQSACYVPFRVTANGNSSAYRAYIYDKDYEGAVSISVLAQHGDKIEQIYEMRIDND